MEAVITSRLDEIERAGKAEVLPSLAEVLDRLERGQTLISVSSDRITLGLQGEQGVLYWLEASADLMAWDRLPLTLNHGGERHSTWVARGPCSLGLVWRNDSS